MLFVLLIRIIFENFESLRLILSYFWLFLRIWCYLNHFLFYFAIWICVKNIKNVTKTTFTEIWRKFLKFLKLLSVYHVWLLWSHFIIVYPFLCQFINYLLTFYVYFWYLTVKIKKFDKNGSNCLQTTKMIKNDKKMMQQWVKNLKQSIKNK